MVNTATHEEKVLNVSFDNMYLFFIKLKNIARDDYNSIQPYITRMRYNNSNNSNNSNKRKHKETVETLDVDNAGYATEEIDDFK